jgi:hypothetical protein
LYPTLWWNRLHLEPSEDLICDFLCPSVSTFLDFMHWGPLHAGHWVLPKYAYLKYIA